MMAALRIMPNAERTMLTRFLNFDCSILFGKSNLIRDNLVSGLDFYANFESHTCVSSSGINFDWSR